MKPLPKRRVQAQRKFAQGAYIFMNNNLPPKNDISPAAVKEGPAKEDRNVIHNKLSAKNLLDVVSFQNIHQHYPVVLVQRLSQNFETANQNGRETGSRASSVVSGVHRKSGGRDFATDNVVSLGREGRGPNRSTSPNSVSSTTLHIKEEYEETLSVASRSTLEPLDVKLEHQNVSETQRFIADPTKRVPIVELTEMDWIEVLSGRIVADTVDKGSQRSTAQSSAKRSDIRKLGTRRRSESQASMSSRLSRVSIGSMTSGRFRATRTESRFSIRSSENGSVSSSEKRRSQLDRFKFARALKRRSKAPPVATTSENGFRLRSGLLKKPLKLLSTKLKAKEKQKPKRKVSTAKVAKKRKNSIAKKTNKNNDEQVYSPEDERPLKYLKVNQNRVPSHVTSSEPGPSARVTRSATEKALATKPGPSRAPSTSSTQDDCFKHPDLPIRFTKQNTDGRASSAVSVSSSTTDEMVSILNRDWAIPVPTPSPPVPPGPQPAPSPGPSPAPSPSPSPAPSPSPSPAPSRAMPPPPPASDSFGGDTTTSEEIYYDPITIVKWIETTESREPGAPSPSSAMEKAVPSPMKVTMTTPKPQHAPPVDQVTTQDAQDSVALPPMETNPPTVEALTPAPENVTVPLKEREAVRQTDHVFARPMERERPRPTERESPRPTGREPPRPTGREPPRPTERESPRPAEREPAEKAPSSRAVSPCPSESMVTIRDVVRAPEGKLDNICQKCLGCYRVTTVTQLATLLTPSEDGNITDVYEFNTESDGIAQPVASFRRPARPTDKDEEDNHIYLDLLPPYNPHIIQMTCVKGQLHTMRARLVPRSNIPTQDLKLVEHENLLEQLLRTLREQKDPVYPEMSNKNNTKQKAKIGEGAKLVEAPIYRIEEGDFNDPIKFFEKVMPIAAKYGLCKVVAPDSFKPKCVLADMLKFKVTNHYIARLYSRWGSAARDMSAMKAYLATQNVTFNRVPLLESLEVNLPKLYAVVQRNGGLKQVIEKKRWGRVAEEMRFNRGPNTEKMLDSYYVKYLLPYDTASNQERQKIIGTVEKLWNKKHKKLLDWATDPLHMQKKLLGESDSESDDDISDSDEEAMKALTEAEDCIVAGRPMNLKGFKKVAKHASDMYLPRDTPSPSVADIEAEYWRLVLFGSDHVCVNAASIDTESGGYGFSKNRQDPFGRHPWNLKMMSSNPGNVLRSLSKVIGVTVPTLHLGMIFSTSCWHRDPHGLPWVEYMHEGDSKIWYGIPDEQSDNFRLAVEALCPTSCQNKSIWLSSDITMIPPNLLREHNVSLSRAVQNPGEFIVVFPKSYSCSISTGFTVSESVYFATHSWLKQIHQVFRELRDSCEPTTFSLEQLLIALAEDPRVSLAVLHTVQDSLTTIINEELHHRKLLAERNIKTRMEPHKQAKRGRSWNARDQEECEICRTSLFLSKVAGLLGKKSPLCLLHAIRMLDRPKYKDANLENVELVVFNTQKRLEDIVANIQKRII